MTPDTGALGGGAGLGAGGLGVGADGGGVGLGAGGSGTVGGGGLGALGGGGSGAAFGLDPLPPPEHPPASASAITEKISRQGNVRRMAIAYQRDLRAVVPSSAGARQ